MLVILGDGKALVKNLHFASNRFLYDMTTDMNSAHCQVHKNKLKFPQKAKVIQQGILQLRADGRTEVHKTEEFPT